MLEIRCRSEFVRSGEGQCQDMVNQAADGCPRPSADRAEMKIAF